MNINDFLKKTELVELYLGDLEFIFDSKKKMIEKAFGKDIDTIIEEIQKTQKLKLSDSIYVSVSPDVSGNNFDILLGIQSLVNSGYKPIYETNPKINFWVK